MLSVTELDNLIKNAVTATAGLNHSVLIVSEEHLRKRLQELKSNEYPLVVALYPSAQGLGSNWDSAQWANSLDFFILTKPTKDGTQTTNYTGRTEEQELADYVRTQNLTKAFLEFIKGGTLPGLCQLLANIPPSNISIDPEYNFQGMDGWSISFSLKTN